MDTDPALKRFGRLSSNQSCIDLNVKITEAIESCVSSKEYCLYNDTVNSEYSC